MRATEHRLWFICVAVVALLGASYAHAQWARSDYRTYARQFVAEIAHVDVVSARVPSPRLVFAGGSSVVYGIDAGRIGRELGVPTVNLGMPSTLGSEANYFDYLLPKIGPGDVVLYTNTHWWVATPRDADVVATQNSRRLADWLWVLARIDLKERERAEWPLLKPIPDLSLLQRLHLPPAPAAPSFPWRRDSLGTMVTCVPYSTIFEPLDAPSTVPAPGVTTLSRQFAQRIKARGAHVIFFESPILIVPRERKAWERYRAMLRADLAEAAPLLDEPDAAMFTTDASRFCDGASHPSDVGRAAWAVALLSQITEMPVIEQLRRPAPPS
jgi:hypothetical protein